MGCVSHRLSANPAVRSRDPWIRKATDIVVRSVGWVEAVEEPQAFLARGHGMPPRSLTMAAIPAIVGVSKKA
ncbi:hypothetical protein GCM10009555_084690 [Acrocarpospora macrocephala]|uniref:Uncharacterized protein n=1 Tax=Acrocarpospora macrocephala TaxID=150177 RepID=A0A5M3WXN0_9ACTN|nr:hypothetical protein Amac_078240 [Acrocarpospora macrocephala]